MDNMSTKLLRWYHANKRDLPWRHTRDPYQIWLSEIILQQTRVEQGLPYFSRFIRRYPTIFDLASAPENDVLRLWQGLGYYTRARNMHRCAKIITKKYNGLFPDSLDELKKLPGIGKYTAAAIASFAFRQKTAVIDGNVISVVTRLKGIDSDPAEKNTQNVIEKIIMEWMPDDAPDQFNQAIMEFGALQCRPASPGCSVCIFNRECHAFRFDMQKSLPAKRKKIKKQNRYFNYLVIEADGRFLLRQRTGKDIWHGLYEYLLIETAEDVSFGQLDLPHEIKAISHEWSLHHTSATVRHVLTHQNIMARFFYIKCAARARPFLEKLNGYTFYTGDEIEKLPKSILTERYFSGKIK